MATVEKVCLIMIKQFDIHGAKCIETNVWDGPCRVGKKKQFCYAKKWQLKIPAVFKFC